MVATFEPNPEMVEPIKRLSKDIRMTTHLLSADKARYLVDLYYQIQNDRIRAAAQTRTLDENGEPNAIIQWYFDNFRILEKDIQIALKEYASQQITGQWAMSITGIGPVIASGLLAHIDITQAPTAGHIWRFAGLDPTDHWLGKAGAAQLVKEVVPTGKLTAEAVIQLAMRVNRAPEKIAKRMANDKGEITVASATAMLARRPWNAKLKRLCWIIGESFVKVSGNDKDYYGHIWRERKELETQRNEQHDYAEQAATILATKNIGHDTDAYKAYIQGMLPPAHIHARAKRYAVKIFISHLQHVMYEAHYGTPPPMPYVITHLQHAHYLSPPNWKDGKVVPQK